MINYVAVKENGVPDSTGAPSWHDIEIQLAKVPLQGAVGRY